MVQKGETIYSIARSFSVDRDELMKLNGITDPTKLQAGQRLKIPGLITPAVPSIQSAGSGAEVFYTVVRGDTFYGLARKYNIKVDEILSANSLDPNYVLKQGDVLRIPGIVPPAGSAAAASIPAAAAVPAAAVTQTAPVKAEPRFTEPKALDASVPWPVEAKDLNYMTGKLSGVVITGEKAESVKSLNYGTVISAGPYRGFGRVAIVQAQEGYIYVYGGCEILSVKEGDKVGPGTEMGRLGIDALTEKPQLFFLVYQNNTPVDPAKAPRALTK